MRSFTAKVPNPRQLNTIPGTGMVKYEVRARYLVEFPAVETLSNDAMRRCSLSASFWASFSASYSLTLTRFPFLRLVAPFIECADVYNAFTTS